METTEEKLEEAVPWDQLETQRPGNFFKPEKDKAYTITISEAKVVLNKKFMDKNGKPKKKVVVKLATLDGKKTELVWETGSWSVINALKECVQNGSLARSTFLLKKKVENEKTTYVFEKTGEKSPSSPFHQESDIEAFLS